MVYPRLLCSCYFLLQFTVLSLQDGNFSPKSRKLQPVAIYQTTGNVSSIAGGSSRPSKPSEPFLLTGPNASVTYDFGQLVAGLATLNFHSATCHGGNCTNYNLPAFNCTGDCQGLRIGFTESPLFVNEWGGTDWTTWFTFPDESLYLPLGQLGTYRLLDKWARGSFRYLTLSFDGATAPDTTVAVAFDNLYFNAAPMIKDEKALGSYTGYFDSSDDLLNKIWDAGVYTVQLNTMPANTSLNISYFFLGGGWANELTSTSLTADDAFIADGAKRNRNPWSADYSIFFRTALVSQNYQNMRAPRNGVQANFVLQDLNATSETFGYFPYAGSPLGDAFRDIPALGFPIYSSDTYQCWAMLSLMEYFIATNDTAWANQYWPQVIQGITATYAFLDPASGLFNGNRTVDWGRDGQGGINIALNAIYYHTLVTAVKLAPRFSAAGDTAKWLQVAERVKRSANDLLWDDSVGLFKDNTTAAGAQVFPQDGNSFAIRYNLTLSSNQSRRIADALSKRLTKFGAPSAELPGFISPFASSHELLAQFASRPNEPAPALSLLRTQWGYMLHAFSNETCIEGYAADGSLGYGFYGDAPAFISFAHAFSTGPTYGLTAYVAGLRTVRGLDVAEDEGDWAWQPGVQGAGVDKVASGFLAPRNRKFDVEWEFDDEKQEFKGKIETPVGELGTVYVPRIAKDGCTAKVSINGKEKTDLSPDASEKYWRVGGVEGAKTDVEVKLKC